MAPPKKGLVIAFGAGGARALASLGVMSVLAKKGIKPVAVSGSSMGALIAAYYGVHGETETLRKWYETKKIKDYLSYLTRPTLTGAVTGIKKLKPLVGELVEYKTFADTIVPVRIVATNLHDGKSVVFSKGPLLDPIMASTAIPGAIPAYKIGDAYYVDGGVTNPTPVDAYPRQHYTHFLGIDFHLQPAKFKEQPGVFDTMTRSFQVATHMAFLHHTIHYKKKCTIITPNNNPDYEVFRFDHAKEHIFRGEIAGRKLVALWKKNGVLEQLQNS